MRILQLSIFISVALALTFGLHYYLWARLVRDPAWPLALTRTLGVAIVLLALSLPVAMALSRFVSTPVSRAFAWAAFGWMGVMALTVSILAVSELVRFPLMHGAVDDDRRQLFGRVLALVGGGASLGLSLYGMRNALKALQVKEVSVSLARLPPALDGFKIVQVNDIHVGSTIRKGFVEHMVETINALSPDIVCIVGDLMDGSVEALGAQMEPLKDIRAKHGVYFVTGNHEYYSGADAWIAFLPTLGIRVLRNERVSIGAEEAFFDLAGIDDWTAHQFGGDHGADLPRALEGRDPSRELVLMAHQPKAAKEASQLGVGLQISGHTHGGQFWPWTHAVRLDSPYVRGMYKVGDMQLYVSTGTGYWGPPMRLGTEAEVTRLTLRSSAPVA